MYLFLKERKSVALLYFEFNFKYAPLPFQSQLQVTCSISKGPTRLLWSYTCNILLLLLHTSPPPEIWDGILFGSQVACPRSRKQYSTVLKNAKKNPDAFSSWSPRQKKRTSKAPAKPLTTEAKMVSLAPEDFQIALIWYNCIFEFETDLYLYLLLLLCWGAATGWDGWMSGVKIKLATGEYMNE